MLLEFILALLPILWLVVSLCYLKMPAYKACSVVFATAVLPILLYWRVPGTEVFTGGLKGATMALWPISLVIIVVIFTYNLTVKTGAMAGIQKMLTSVLNDKWVLVLIVTWGFGGFMEGMADFGTTVVIPANILCGLGFNPIFVAVVCLVANATPTAFGSTSVPTVTAASVSGLDPQATAVVVLLQLFLVVVLTPFLLVMTTGGGSKSLKNSWHIVLIFGLGFAAVQLLAARFTGAELPAVTGSVASMLPIIFAAKVFCKNTPKGYQLSEETSAGLQKRGHPGLREAVILQSPLLLIFVFLLTVLKLVSLIYNALTTVKTSVVIYAGVGATPYTFFWLTTPGVLVFIAAFPGGLLQRASLSDMVQVLAQTLKQMLKIMITLITILAAAKTMGCNGMTCDIAALLITATGTAYPLVAPPIGSIGTLVIGSVTSSSVLFSSLQAETARAIGLQGIWLVAANTIGATTGKIISPQSITIAVASTRTSGEESNILRTTLKYHLLYIVIFGLISYLGYSLLSLV